MSTAKEPRSMSRRRFLAATAAATLGGMLAGCAAPAAPVPAAKSAAPTVPAAQPTPVPAPKSAAGPVKLRKMAWGSALEKENIEKGLAAFEQQNPNIKVEYIHVPQDYDAKLQTMLAAGDAPDVFKVGDGPYADYIQKGALLDIGDLVAGDSVLGKPDYFIMPWEKERSSYQGKWYGIGSCAQFYCLYCNLDLLEKAKVDPPSVDAEKAWTWDQFVEVGRKLTVDQSGKHPGESGFDVTKVAQWGLYYPTATGNIYCNVHSNGGKFMDPATLRYTLDTPQAIEAIQAVADLALKHQVAPKAAFLGELGMNAWQMLASGKVGIIMDGNWALQDIAKMNFRFTAGVLPKMKVPATTMRSSITGVSKSTKTVKESWELFRYLNLDDYQVGLVKVGLWGPSHKSLLTPEGVKRWLTTGVHSPKWEQMETEYKVKYGFFFPNVVGNFKANTVLTQGLDPIWIGQKTAKEAAPDATAKANKVLDEAAAG